MTTETTSTPAFVTGSRRYGKPTPDSDLDLVILVEDEDAQKLLIEHGGEQDDDGRLVIRFGKLNLIVCRDIEQYEAWKDGTEACVKVRHLSGQPVGRDHAIEILSAFRSDLQY